MVVGAGPNGIIAAITLAQSGVKVTILERSETVGGSVKSVSDLNYPQITHDWGAASFPLALLSPALREVNWNHFGVDWLTSSIPFGHALPNAKGLLVHRNIDEMVDSLGKDGKLWSFLFKQASLQAEALGNIFLARESLFHPSKDLLRFGPTALLPASAIARLFPLGPRGPGSTLFAAAANHSQLSLNSPGSAGVGLLLLSAAHSVGWPIPKGGSGKIIAGLIELAKTFDITIRTNVRASDSPEIKLADIVIWDIHPDDVAYEIKNHIEKGLRNKLKVWGDSGVGVTKLDLVIDSQIPWLDPKLNELATVHIGGSFQDMARSKLQVRRGVDSRDPYIIVSQPASLDESRKLGDLQPISAYTQHPTTNSDSNIKSRPAQILDQLEKCAPGLSSKIKSIAIRLPSDLESANPNLRRGDIFGGASNFKSMLQGPLGFVHHYQIRGTHHYVCSSATWPGTGVHGMSGRNAAVAAIKRELNYD